MNTPFKRQKESYTYADYLEWPDDERWEIIEGAPYNMSPAPGTEHQQILVALLLPLANYFKDRNCQVFPAPFDVRLPRGDEKDEEISTVVQPDITVVFDSSKLDKKGCKGVPDIVVEILSHSTAKKDLSEKFNLYEKNGVQEYWIIFPWEKAIDIYYLNQDKRYEKTTTYFARNILTSDLFPNLEIDLAQVFEVK